LPDLVVLYILEYVLLTRLSGIVFHSRMSPRPTEVKIDMTDFIGAVLILWGLWHDWV